MSHLGPNRQSSLRGIVRDVFVLVLAEAVVLGVAWCLSRQGRSMLAQLFRRKRADTQASTIDV